MTTVVTRSEAERSSVTQRSSRPGSAAARRFRRGGLANIIALVFSLLMLFPAYWMINTAFKPNQKIQSATPSFLPFPGTFSHFVDAVHNPYFWTYVLNSLIVSVTTVGFAIVVGLMAALALALSRFRFRGWHFFLVLVLVVQMAPLTALIIPLLIALRQFDLLDKLPGLIVAYVAFVLPFSIWVLRGFVINVPLDLEEAAMVDGCGRTQAFERVVLPLIAPGLVATTIYSFMQAWNQFLFPLVLVQHQRNYTLGVARLIRDQPGQGLRRVDGCLHALRSAGRDQLPLRAAPRRVGPTAGAVKG